MSGIKKAFKKSINFEKKIFKKVKTGVKKLLKNKFVRAIVIAAAIYFTAGAAAGMIGTIGTTTSVWAGAASGVSASWGALATGFAAGGVGGALSAAGTNFAANAAVVGNWAIGKGATNVAGSSAGTTGAGATATATTTTGTGIGASAGAGTGATGIGASAGTAGTAGTGATSIGASGSVGTGIGASGSVGTGVGATGSVGVGVSGGAAAPVAASSNPGVLGTIAGLAEQYPTTTAMLANAAVNVGKSMSDNAAANEAYKRQMAEEDRRRREAYDFGPNGLPVYNPQGSWGSLPSTRPVSLEDVLGMSRNGYISYTPSYTGSGG